MQENECRRNIIQFNSKTEKLKLIIISSFCIINLKLKFQETLFIQSSDFISLFIQQHDILRDKEFSVYNLALILTMLFIQVDKNKLSDSSFLILSDLIDGAEFGEVSVSEENRKRLLDIKNELLNRFIISLPNISTQSNSDSQIIPPTPAIIREIGSQQPQQQSHEQQQLPQQNRLIINETQVTLDNSSNVNVNMSDLSNIIRQIIKEEVTNSNKSSSVQIINNNKKTLTRTAYTELRQSVMIRYEKLMKLENTIALFNSHLDNNTVPFALSFVKFPKPLWCDDPIFVDAHNEIIRNTQKQMICEIISRGKTVIECLNVELTELRSQLDSSYDGNKEKFFDNIKATVANNLKPFFEASNAKLLRLQNNYFEDQINTVYEVQDTIPVDYVNNYLQINNQSAQDDLNINISKKVNNNNNYHSNKQNNSYNNNNINQKNINHTNNQHHYKNRQYNNNNNYNNNSNYRSYKKRKQNENEAINDNWRHNMNLNNNNNTDNSNNNINFRVATNQKSKT